MMRSLEKIEAELRDLPSIHWEDFQQDQTAIVIVDMINGFANEGNLASDRVQGLIKPIEKLLVHASAMRKVFLCDHHPVDATEFESYLPHGIQGSSEAMIVEELYRLQDSKTSVIFKNSTNGMMVPEMRHYLEANSDIENFIVVGDCTDICIMQFVLSLKAHFNELNIQKRILVSKAHVDTFDLEATNHDADLMNLFALYNMKMNGIDIVKTIQFE